MVVKANTQWVREGKEQLNLQHKDITNNTKQTKKHNEYNRKVETPAEFLVHVLSSLM
jgi:hypothetical protein